MLLGPSCPEYGEREVSGEGEESIDIVCENSSRVDHSRDLDYKEVHSLV